MLFSFVFVVVGASLRSGNPGNEASLRAEAGGIDEGLQPAAVDLDFKIWHFVFALVAASL